ncbi:uncharacterized protein PAC_01117 [Phialocephala subalpina]|uniref:Transmembrane protein n=1 Tax=Phialocephala subalpina TaxID=576137 RepID=A0A1L7WEP0_9HELO|nr:uncharacterized protein PAC_01117 [Phialocephala subalpina]
MIGPYVGKCHSDHQNHRYLVLSDAFKDDTLVPQYCCRASELSETSENNLIRHLRGSSTELHGQSSPPMCGQIVRDGMHANALEVTQNCPKSRRTLSWTHELCPFSRITFTNSYNDDLGRRSPSRRTMRQGNYTNLGEAFPQLINLTAATTGRSQHLGGQNFTHCCLLAVNESLAIKNGFIVENTPTFIQASVDQLLSATADSQFPCTAVWNGNKSGTPVIQVPDSWLEHNCPGWQLSSSMAQAQWITPFVGFLLPAIIFCLSVPRRRKVTIYEKVFTLDFSRPKAWLLAPFDMILAWLSGPMLMSGLYEAYLDNLLIRFIQEKTKESQLTLDMRVRLLFVMLCGNLDLNPDLTSEEMQLVDYRNPENSEQWPNYSHYPRTGLPNTLSAWAHIEYLIHPLRTYRDMAIMTPRQQPLHDTKCKVADCDSAACLESPLPRSLDMVRLIGRTKTQLRTMLACQTSFGATVGAPVVFYLGTFVFTIVATLTNLGDHDTSIEIAFRMWYMILPHIAVVSGLLLAGNNPNALEGVLAHDIVWMTYEYCDPARRGTPPAFDKDMLDLREKTAMTVKGWAVVLGLTLLLLEVPYVLAFLTAFYTPQVGVSCRSLTFTVHAITQLCLMCLWIWAWGDVPDKCLEPLPFLRRGSWLEKSGFYTPTTNHVAWRNPKTRCSMKSLWAVLWFGCATILGLSSVFISIGGTLMQLIGVYRSDFCDLNAPWWTKPHGSVQVVISTNSALDIKAAGDYWMSTGITATAFLAAVCFSGWWYQRRLRGVFRDLVNDLGNVGTERDDVLTAISKLKRGQSSARASSM